MKKIPVFVLFAALLVTLTACAPGSTVNVEELDTEIQFTLPGVNPQLNEPAENGRVPGFGTGFWHGLVALITLFVSFFNPAVQMYEVHNNGPMYNLGFLLGTILLFGLLGFMGGRRR
ncbi:MAG: hypothetical protein QY332_14925 [Anaerolineales bacterium]|nr:MAG: hypothetical protein QY332_14925 [Anaerolineales bacterium]